MHLNRIIKASGARLSAAGRQCLLSVTDHCLRSRNYVNVIVAGKQPAPQWLDMDAAVEHCTTGSACGNGRATTAAASPTW